MNSSRLQPNSSPDSRLPWLVKSLATARPPGFYSQGARSAATMRTRPECGSPPPLSTRRPVGRVLTLVTPNLCAPAARLVLGYDPKACLLRASPATRHPHGTPPAVPSGGAISTSNPEKTNPSPATTLTAVTAADPTAQSHAHSSFQERMSLIGQSRNHLKMSEVIENTSIGWSISTPVHSQTSLDGSGGTLRVLVPRVPKGFV
jgi:hypothetical protein